MFFHQKAIGPIVGPMSTGNLRLKLHGNREKHLLGASTNSRMQRQQPTILSMLRPRGSMMAGLPHGPHYQHRPRADNSKKQVAWLGSTTVKVQCHQAGFPKSQINPKKISRLPTMGFSQLFSNFLDSSATLP